jgi:hypothetical protein
MNFPIKAKRRSFGGSILFIEDANGPLVQMIPSDNNEAASIIVETANRGAVLNVGLCQDWLHDAISNIKTAPMGDKETKHFTFAYDSGKGTYWVNKKNGERVGYTDDISRDPKLFVEVYESVMSTLYRQ